VNARGFRAEEYAVGRARAVARRKRAALGEDRHHVLRERHRRTLRIGRRGPRLVDARRVGLAGAAAERQREREGHERAAEGEGARGTHRGEDVAWLSVAAAIEPRRRSGGKRRCWRGSRPCTFVTDFLARLADGDVEGRR